ncbi:FAD-dependent oxidoreductase [Paenibacillus sp. KR2-11]|uniref:FAD-dependent oxidoreductase n=1 Tax=Paenibacillus sp. KR2-11 TaxID=3385500 RepID=UPI0038FCC77D
MKKKRSMLTVGLLLLALVAVAAVASVMSGRFGSSPPQTAAEPSVKGQSDGGRTAGTLPDGQMDSAGTAKEADLPEEKVDIAVIGSELEGLYLARAAADEGLKVKIIDPRPAFGGQVLQGEMLFLDETRDEQHRLMVQGRAKELFDGFRAGKIRKLSEFGQYFDKLKKDIPVEQGVKIDAHRLTAGKFGGESKLASLDYTTKDGAKKRLTAAYFVENTDYAAVVSKLQGAVRMPGLEAFYGQKDIEYMSAGYMMKFKNVDWAKFQSSFEAMTPKERSAKYGYGSVDHSYAIGLSGMTSKYKPSSDRLFLRGFNAVHQRDGEVLINAFLVYTVNPADDQSVAEAMELGKKEMPLLLEHFRRNITGWEHAELNGYPSYPYIREYNHYETDYVLKVSDMLGARMFWDNVSIGGYPLDLQGTSANKWGIEMGRPDKYGMPLRSFLLKNYDNVILAGKNVGSSAIAYGSARIQPNTSLAAESIGVILGQIQGKKTLRDVGEADMPALHAYLASKYAIKLTGVTGRSKIEGWTAEEIAKLDTGEIVYPSYIQKRKK